MGAFFDWLLSNLNWMIPVIVILAVAIPSLTVVPQADERACQQKSSNFFSATKDLASSGILFLADGRLLSGEILRLNSQHMLAKPVTDWMNG